MQQQQLAAQLAHHTPGSRPPPLLSPTPSTSDSDISLGANSPPNSSPNVPRFGPPSPSPLTSFRFGPHSPGPMPPQYRFAPQSPPPGFTTHSPPRGFRKSPQHPLSFRGQSPTGFRLDRKFQSSDSPVVVDGNYSSGDGTRLGGVSPPPGLRKSPPSCFRQSSGFVQSSGFRQSPGFRLDRKYEGAHSPIEVDGNYSSGDGTRLEGTEGRESPIDVDSNNEYKDKDGGSSDACVDRGSPSRGQDLSPPMNLRVRDEMKIETPLPLRLAVPHQMAPLRIQVSRASPALTSLQMDSHHGGIVRIAPQSPSNPPILHRPFSPSRLT